MNKHLLYIITILCMLVLISSCMRAVSGNWNLEQVWISSDKYTIKNKKGSGKLLIHDDGLYDIDIKYFPVNEKEYDAIKEKGSLEILNIYWFYYINGDIKFKSKSGEEKLFHFVIHENKGNGTYLRLKTSNFLEEFVFIRK